MKHKDKIIEILKLCIGGLVTFALIMISVIATLVLDEKTAIIILIIVAFLIVLLKFAVVALGYKKNNKLKKLSVSPDNKQSEIMLEDSTDEILPIEPFQGKSILSKKTKSNMSYFFAFFIITVVVGIDFVYGGLTSFSSEFGNWFVYAIDNITFDFNTVIGLISYTIVWCGLIIYSLKKKLIRHLITAFSLAVVGIIICFLINGKIILWVFNIPTFPFIFELGISHYIFGIKEMRNDFLKKMADKTDEELDEIALLLYSKEVKRNKFLQDVENMRKQLE
jgi:hypothetical protein